MSIWALDLVRVCGSCGELYHRTRPACVWCGAPRPGARPIVDTPIACGDRTCGALDCPTCRPLTYLDYLHGGDDAV